MLFKSRKGNAAAIIGDHCTLHGYCTLIPGVCALVFRKGFVCVPSRLGQGILCILSFRCDAQSFKGKNPGSSCNSIIITLVLKHYVVAALSQILKGVCPIASGNHLIQKVAHHIHSQIGLAIHSSDAHGPCFAANHLTEASIRILSDLGRRWLAFLIKIYIYLGKQPVCGTVAIDGRTVIPVLILIQPYKPCDLTFCSTGSFR